MKKIIASAWILFCFLILACFFISCFSAYIKPLDFSYITFFAIGFPYLFISVLIIALINLFVRNKLGVFMLICLLVGIVNLTNTFAFNLPKKFNDSKSDSALRIMTWNVEDFVSLWDTSRIRARMLKIIQQKNPDVLCIQEFTSVDGGKWRVSVRKELDSIGYPYCFLSNDEVTTNAFDAKVTRGAAIFSKHPFTDTGRVNIRHDEMNENMVYATVNFNNKPVRIFTAHLASFALYKDTDNVNKDIYKITYDRKRAIEYRLREVEQMHQEEATVIREKILTSQFPVVYCGDMNAVPSSYNYHLLCGDLQDAFLKKGFAFGSTFYKVLPLLRIDYCLVDKRFTVTQCTVIDEKLSDHYPVITDIQWK